ncbi:hypothetical protein CABS01_08976 [Colletotrichum abscissum]|uniref:F-box domain-containing protein n=1 Tax=Colletotrichum abscissum TaxID=1671311 RepID=A0A9Q0AXP7_9PEZI|nr:uncharacterized protein CABS01_08976 [Colletotrichum abscissum]KAI3536140.1 hypothetical protein CABS02_12635 [Colletotrichum abscissum]KAK1503587.1 hypothetical protein CABS01_08976 [Colletotrichum abscissum]
MKITNLPCEIVAEILSQLDKIQDLKAPLLSCRLFYNAYTQRPRLAQQIVRKQIPTQLLPYAVALIYAPRARKFALTFNALNLTPEDADTLVFSSTFGGAVASTRCFQTFSLPHLLAMEAAHELIAEFASHFAEKAWTAVSDTLNDTTSTKSMPSHLDLSQKEWLRFCRCFYRVELCHGLFTMYGSDEARNVHMTQGDVSLESGVQFKNRGRLNLEACMLADLALWEVEQLGAAMEYLSDRFVAAAARALANDVVEHRGLVYLRSLEKKSYVEKSDLLHSEPRTFLSYLYLELRLLHHVHKSEARHNTKLDASWQELNLSDIDGEEGPRKALDCIAPHHVMEIGLEGLRERAYVFWDQERLEKYDFFSVISSSTPFRGVNS